MYTRNTSNGRGARAPLSRSYGWFSAGRCPARKHSQTVGRGAAGLGVDRPQHLGRQLQRAHHGVVQTPGTGRLGANAVPGPPDPELIAAGAQLSDQGGQGLVVRPASGPHMQERDGVAGNPVSASNTCRRFGRTARAGLTLRWPAAEQFRARPATGLTGQDPQPVGRTSGACHADQNRPGCRAREPRRHATAFQAGPDGDERAGAVAVIVVDTGTAAGGAGRSCHRLGVHLGSDTGCAGRCSSRTASIPVISAG